MLGVGREQTTDLRRTPRGLENRLSINAESKEKILRKRAEQRTCRREFRSVLAYQKRKKSMSVYSWDK